METKTERVSGPAWFKSFTHTFNRLHRSCLCKSNNYLMVKVVNSPISGLPSHYLHVITVYQFYSGFPGREKTLKSTIHCEWKLKKLSLNNDVIVLGCCFFYFRHQTTTSAPRGLICLLPEANCVLSFWRQITSGVSLSCVLTTLKPHCQ